MSMSTGLRSIKLLQKHGFAADMVERRNRFIAKDFLGCIDLIGVRAEDQRIIGVQATSSSHRSTRVRKIVETESLVVLMKQWLAAGCELEVWSWGQRSGSNRWRLGRDVISLPNDQSTSTGLVVVRNDAGFE